MEGGKRCAGAVVVVSSLFLVLVVPLVQAPAVGHLAGQVSFASTQASTADVETTSSGAAYLAATDRTGLTGDVRIRASAVTVKWSRVDKIGVADPTDPDESAAALSEGRSHGETVHGPSDIAIPLHGATSGDLLFLPRSEVHLEANASDLSVGSTDGEEWWGGQYSNRTEGPDRQLVEIAEIPAGSPVYRTTAPGGWILRGDLTIAVWGSNVTVDPDDGETAHYRSGEWHTNETAGTVREEHHQLLRLRLTHAEITVDHDRGLAQWTTDRAKLRSGSGVDLRGASGHLESARDRFAFSDTALQINGHVALTVSADAGVDGLTSHVEGDDVWVNVAPTSRVRAGPATVSTSAVPLSLLFPGALLAAATAAVLLRDRWPRIRRRILPSDLGIDREETPSPGDAPVPDRIRGFIEQHPGARATQVADAMGIHYKTARYHLDALADGDGLVRRRFGNRVRYFEAERFSRTFQAAADAVATSGRRELVEALSRTDGGVHVQRLAEQVDRSPSTVSNHLKKLHRHDLVARSRRGRRVEYRLTAEAREAYRALD